MFNGQSDKKGKIITSCTFVTSLLGFEGAKKELVIEAELGLFFEKPLAKMLEDKAMKQDFSVNFSI